MKFALRRREGELTALLSTAVSTGPIYPRLGNYVPSRGLLRDYEPSDGPSFQALHGTLTDPIWSNDTFCCPALAGFERMGEI